MLCAVLGAEGAAGGGVGVVRVVHRHTADHVGPLARSRAAGEKKEESEIPVKISDAQTCCKKVR